MLPSVEPDRRKRLAGEDVVGREPVGLPDADFGRAVVATHGTGSEPQTTAADQPLKFAKGGFYLDHAEDLWFCTNGKTKQVNDTQTVVLMKATEAGEPVPED